MLKNLKNRKKDFIFLATLRCYIYLCVGFLFTFLIDCWWYRLKKCIYWARCFNFILFWGTDTYIKNYSRLLNMRRICKDCTGGGNTSLDHESLYTLYYLLHKYTQVCCFLVVGFVHNFFGGIFEFLRLKNICPKKHKNKWILQYFLLKFWKL